MDDQRMAPRRVLLIASGGGHWVQLCRLRAAFADCDTQFVTTLSGTSAPIGDRPVIVVRDASRQEPLQLILLAARLFRLMVAFRPDIVVTTGAAPGLIALQVGRLFGARTVWIDSIANAEELSLSGKLAGRVADLWLTQWEPLTASHPGLQYYGRVL
jgi:UDP-N-acetylglucosamine:LPS N-acetylglucosamine transferase